MVSSRKGLVAPQNTFLENVLRRFGNPHSGLLVANANIVDYPIVYVNEIFTKLTGYTAREMLQTSAMCQQLHGERTSINAIERIKAALEHSHLDQVEATLYRKNRSMLWVVMCVAPVEDDKGSVLLYLILLHDISLLRQPMDDDLSNRLTSGGGGGFSKFAKLARSVARNRVMLTSQNELDESTGTAPGPLHRHMIPKYRQESPVTPVHILLHYVAFKTAWDWLILLLTGYIATVVPYTMAVKPLPSLGVVDRIVDVIFLIDIVLNFHTTFVGPTGAVVSDPSLIRLNYLKGWFLLDLLACMPYGLFNLFQNDPTKSIDSLFRTLKLFRLLRLFRVIRKLDQYLQYVASILLIMIFCFILLAHWLACVWYTVGQADFQAKIRNGWIGQLTVEMSRLEVGSRSNVTGLQLHGPRSPDDNMLYMTSLYFTLSLITSIGFGNVAANTITEKVVSLVFMVIGAIVYATIFGNVTTILQQTYASRARLQQLMGHVKDFLRIHCVPKELSERVVDYVTSTWSITRGVDTDTVLNNCPKDMKADLCVHLYRAVFNEHPAFRLASESCLRALAVLFKAQHNAPGDLIFHQGESIDQLCFVISGSLEVIQDDEIVAILSKGDVLGQPIKLDQSDLGQSAASVRALTYCDLHCIKHEDLVSVLKFYSLFANSFTRSLVLTYNLRNRLVFRKLADLVQEKQLEELDDRGGGNKSIDAERLSYLANSQAVRRIIARLAASSSSSAARASSAVKGTADLAKMSSCNTDGDGKEVVATATNRRSVMMGKKQTSLDLDKLKTLQMSARRFSNWQRKPTRLGRIDSSIESQSQQQAVDNAQPGGNTTPNPVKADVALNEQMVRDWCKQQEKFQTQLIEQINVFDETFTKCLDSLSEAIDSLDQRLLLNRRGADCEDKAC